MPEPWTKADLINRIATSCGYRSYLEICSATTGFRYREIDRGVFTLCHRMMYHCPPGFSDGMPIDFRAESLDSAEGLRAVRAQRRRYDLILVDPWHEYATSLRDLAEALSLLAERGTMVVHDSLPGREEIAGPDFVDGDWTGVTYKAYLDFVGAHPEVEYRTVDIDFGCGVIRRRSGPAKPSKERIALLEEWAAIGDDYAAAYRFARDHRVLWNVVSLEDFLRDG